MRCSELYLERALRVLITDNIAKNEEDPKLGYLFDSDSAPLRGFGAKIRMARALGLINIRFYDDLETIRHIRNMFAHSMDAVSFTDKTIAGMCNGLSLAFPPFKEPESYYEKLRAIIFETPMYKFVKVADLYFSFFTKDHPGMRVPKCPRYDGN
jgi:DNA-binding MltR family transcriptional regulator